jgi:FKBP-type peptidyl-prolyl cis-trans isomerase SlyD
VSTDFHGLGTHWPQRFGLPWLVVKIEKGKRVRLKLKLQVVGGEVIEQSVVEYFQGAGKMIAGLERALEGLAAGDKKEGVIPAAQAFGDPTYTPKKTISRKEFPADAKLEKGSEFAAKSETGQDVVLVVDAVTADVVEVRLCHPLAKKDIQFQAEIMAVTDPMPPPLPGAALVEDSD